MRVTIDASRCQGHNRCVAESDTLFCTDEEGYALVKLQPASPAEEESARRAALACPEGAIAVDED